MSSCNNIILCGSEIVVCIFILCNGSFVINVTLRYK